MRSKIFRGFIAAALLVSLTACGEKKDSNRTLLPGRDIGCFDLLGPRVTRYFKGEIENAEWQDTFDCVRDQVTFFRKYVRGEYPNAFSQADIAALIRKFLIVRQPVSDQFVSSLFEIKASVFGGSSIKITTAEVDEFLRLSEVIRKESSALLPQIQAKRRAPSSQNLLVLADGVGKFGFQVANYLSGLSGSTDVKKDDIMSFARELLALHGGDPTIIDRYGDFSRNLKVVIAGGQTDRIEPKKWPLLVREGASTAGLLLAYRDMEEQLFVEPADRDLFLVSLARRSQVILNRLSANHGSGIPLTLIDPVVDTLPNSPLSVVQRSAIKSDMRAITLRTLRGGIRGRLTPRAIDNAVDIFENGMRRQHHLKRIYATITPNPNKVDFEAAARKYQSAGGAGRSYNEVNQLIAEAKTYIGLFREGADEMVFTSDIRDMRSRNHMINMSWSNTLIRYALSVYATGPTLNTGKTAQKSDLSEMTKDFYQILRAWKLAHPKMTTMEMAIKRFREANLFMPTSNGDSYMDTVEGTYYLSYLISSSAFSNRVFDQVSKNSRDWSGCPIVGVDDLDQPAFAADCFRRVYFGFPGAFWQNFPGLRVAYEGMSVAQRALLAQSMEAAARRGGYSEKPIGPFDIDSFAALPHYVESLIIRFDEDRNQILSKRELLDRAYPVFRETLATTAGTNSNFLLRGLLTYLIRYGRAPPSSLALLAWSLKLKVTNVEADRNSIYRVVAILSEPVAPKTTTNDTWPVGDADAFPTTESP